MPFILPGFVALALMALPAAGQGNVLVVDAAGGGAYASIQAAINAASDGDTILVKAGTYGGFSVVAKSVTITGDLGHLVNVNGQLLIANLAPAQTVVLRGLKVTVLFVPGMLTPPPTFQNDAGQVWVEDCVIVDSNLGPSFSGYQGHGVALDNCASVVFTRCSITGSTGTSAGNGIHSVSSSVTLQDCTLKGGDVQVSILPIAGGDAFNQNGGFLFASGTTFIGGKGSGGVTVTAQGLPPVCHNGGPGGNGIVLSGLNPVAFLLAATLTPGVGGIAQTQYGCLPGAPGQPSVVNAGTLNTVSGVARHYAASSPIRGGFPSSLLFQAPAGESVWLAYWTAPAHAFLPTVFGTLVVGGPPALVPIATMPASGALSVAITAPDPTPGLVGITFFSQAAFVAGSSAFLGPASAITVVNSAVP